MERIGKVIQNMTRPSSEPSLLNSERQDFSPPTTALPDCGDCGGTGWFRQPVPPFAAPLPLVPCKCTEQRHQKYRQEYVTQHCGLTQAQRDTWRFDNFLPKLNPGCAEALRACQAWARGRARPWLLLQGPPGLGKTHLLIAATGYLVQAGVAVRYETAPELYYRVLAAVKDETYAALVESYKRQAVLVLDDLGAERGTEFAADLLHSILDSRYAEQRPTLLANNPELAGFPPRLKSRLGDLAVCARVPLEGVDVRSQMREAAR